MNDFTHAWFHDTVSALAYSVAQAHAANDPAESEAPCNDLTQFILQQQAQMPDYLRAPMLAATLGFDSFGLLKTGHLFHSRPPAIRKRQIEAWKKSKLGFQRDLIRYYESLATLALYSRREGNAAASGLAPNQRQLIAESLRATRPLTPSLSPNGGEGARGAGEGELVLIQGQSSVEACPESLRCEIAVIGSGPGGAITAGLLAEAGRDVLLIEEGPFHPLESCEPFSKEEMLRKYRNGGQTVAFGKNKIAYVEGRCVGGGSEINSGLYHRTPLEVLDLWRREFEVEGLTENDLGPHFEACERDLSVSLLPSGAAPPASLKLHEGATRLGWKSLEVPRWFRHDGATARGTRQSMTQTFVPRFLTAGGRLLPGTRARRIRQDGSKWLIEAQTDNARTIRIEAGVMFICCGAVQTPALLRRSGIKQNIGNSLRLHPTVKVVAQFPEAVNSADMGVPVHQVKEFSPRLSFGCSISTRAYLALGMIDHPAHAHAVREAWPRMANYYAMITGEGRGSVRTLANFRDPLVRYRLTESDRRDLADGLRKLAEILFEAGATSLYPGVAHGPPLLCRDDLKHLPDVLPDGLASLMTIHLFSSCPMGEDKTRCAVDSFGRVHGFKNLFVADASLLCTAPGVNPQGSIMALARRNALQFLRT